MNLKLLARIAGGAALLLFGLFAPLYVGCELLPDGWFSPKYWWSFPFAVLNIITGFACVFGGIFMVAGACVSRGDE